MQSFSGIKKTIAPHILNHYIDIQNIAPLFIIILNNNYLFLEAYC
jgi:hypothetical protein